MRRERRINEDMTNTESRHEHDNSPEKELARRIRRFTENCAVVPVAEVGGSDPIMNGFYRIPATAELPAAELLVRCRYDQGASRTGPSGCEVAAVDPVISGPDAVFITVEVGDGDIVYVDGEPYSADGHAKVEELFEWINTRRLEPDSATRQALVEQERLRGEITGIFEPIHPEEYLPDSGQSPSPRGE